ncbi:CHAT domain-containing protein [Kordia sp. SMS9]|uniref:CHAT domain-containing protein n=1 Tax=Kordia sp. SMS9 TaxID=2282170 RepID=UPI0013B35A32|nr:CHAT domain-containing protein [Kordia sp. SMS9]
MLAFKIDSVQKIQNIKVKKEGFKIILQQQDTLVETEGLGTLYHALGNSHYEEKKYDKAFFYIQKAVKIRKKYKNLENLNESRYKLAAIYNKQEKPQKRYALLEEIINDHGIDEFTNKAHRVLGKIERNKGDYHKSISFLESGFLNKPSQKLKYENILRFSIILTYAKKYQSTFDLDESNADLQKIESHKSSIEKNAVKDVKSKLSPKNLAAMHNSIAIVYDGFQDLEKALHYYKKALGFYSKNADLSKELEVLNNIGLIYYKQKKNTQAYEVFNRVITESKDGEQLAMAYDNVGYYLPNMSAKDKIPYFQKAIYAVLEKGANEEFQLPTLVEIKALEYEQDVLIYLIDLADHYVQAFEQTKEKKYLHKAKETVILIDELVSNIRYEVETEASKLFWIERGVNTYVLAVEICYLLQDAEKAFYFMEKNKALLLQENIKTFQAKLMSNIPKSTLEREYKLNYEIVALQEEFRLQGDNDELKQQYIQKNEEHKTFMDSMQRMYPKYIKTKEKVAIVSLQNVIKKYKNQEIAFVEYILHETDGYGIFYDGKTPDFFKIEAVENFQKQLQFIRNFITQKDRNTKERKEFQTIGHQVFQQLFPFDNALERLQHKKLTIIPDQALQHIPFEVLPTNTSETLSKAYFVNTTETAYLQSFSLFEQIQQKQNAPTKKILAIAPIEFQNKALPTLTEATEVFKSFEKDTLSVFLQKTDATKENFLKYRNNFNIIHLNTHAGLDNITQTPWIAFYDSNMTLNELFGLENQAELVILDACKTNDGINLSGEGIINLSRGFFYNGTQSVLASQWNVNEKAGNEILQTFYTELENGNSKSKALQLAKKNYLQQHEAEQNIPYYWAAFTLTGSTDAVVNSSWWNAITMTFGVMILILILFYYRKKIFK